MSSEQRGSSEPRETRQVSLPVTVWEQVDELASDGGVAPDKVLEDAAGLYGAVTVFDDRVRFLQTLEPDRDTAYESIRISMFQDVIDAARGMGRDTGQTVTNIINIGVDYLTTAYTEHVAGGNILLQRKDGKVYSFIPKVFGRGRRPLP